MENIKMALTLAEIRAKLQKQDEKKTVGSFSDGVTYPHWDIPENESCKLRILPDADPKNDFFWVERNIIKLEFNGVVGDPTSKPVHVQVPCIEMWPDMGPCPILSEVRPWYKDESLKETANKYWKKRSYICQGFVRENPIKEENAPENPIRKFVLTGQLFNLIKAAIMDPELENMPTDYDAGLDFIIQKTKKGQYADYGTSKWARKETALTVEEREAIEKFGLFDLKEFMPKRPTAEELSIIVDMFHASVDGDSYDLAKWGKYFKPFGLKADKDSDKDSNKEASSSAAEVSRHHVASHEESGAVEEQAHTPTASSASDSSKKAQEILAMIKNRKSA